MAVILTGCHWSYPTSVLEVIRLGLGWQLRKTKTLVGYGQPRTQQASVLFRAHADRFR